MTAGRHLLRALAVTAAALAAAIAVVAYVSEDKPMSRWSLAAASVAVVMQGCSEAAWKKRAPPCRE